jgi:MinD superfamily P-loop ATPase
MVNGATGLNHTLRQLVILSGKGGTGKTSITAALAHLAFAGNPRIQAVLVDADVDAANLGLVLQPDLGERHEFWGGSLAEIDPAHCKGCGACEFVCRYDAIIPGVTFAIDPTACDGCAACVYACPEQAIRMVQQQEGEWFHSSTRFGPLFHAELYPGRDNSGKLVTLIKQHAKLLAEDQEIPLVIIDGPPGIGCPVISASAGADLALVVTEPSLSGLHDLQRALGMLQHFRVKPLVVINKADLYPQGSKDIHKYAAEHEVEVIGEVPFDAAIVEAMVHGQPVTAYRPETVSAQAIRSFWEILAARLHAEEVAR